MDSIVASIICTEFQKQFKDAGRRNEAMVVTFDLRIDHEKEEGYRWLDILIYAPTNYVTVEVRERWNVIPVEGLAYDEKTDDSYVKEGFDYVEGASEWKRVSHHDSAWRTDGVEHTLRDYRDRVLLIESFGSEGWYNVENYEVP